MIQQLLGPWPYRPLWMFVFITTMQHFGITGLLSGPDTPSDLALVGLGLGRLAFAVALAAAVVAAQWVTYRVTTLGRSQQGAPAYVTTIVTGAIAAMLVLAGWQLIQAREVTPVFIVGTFVHYLLMLVILQTSIGIIGSRMSTSEAQAKEALDRLSAQERRFVAAEERARRIAAEFLHDRVQADLLVIAIELRRVAEHSPANVASELASITEAVETIRLTDVRDTSRSLSPMVQATGLASALSTLAQRWQPAMAVSLSIDDRVGAPGDATHDQDLPLGIYRIVEQALLNAAAHGRARQAQVSVTQETGRIRVRITDDGAGFSPADEATGGGFAISEVWARLLGGTWSVESSPGHGATVTAWLPDPRDPMTLRGSR